MPDWVAQFWQDYTLRNVLLGTAWIGVVGGSLGTIALLRRQSLLGDVISHATLPGVALAFLLWQQREIGILMAGAAAAGLLATLAIFAIDVNTRINRDGAMGLILALFFGTGLFLLSLLQNLPTARKAGLDKFILGQAAALVQSDLIALLAAGLPVLLLLLVFWKELKLVSFDPDYATAIGLPVRCLDLLVLGLIVVTIVMGLQAVGVILMSAVLIAPAAAARQWTNQMSAMVAIAGLCGAASGMTGAVISSLGPHIPTGPVVVLALTVIVVVSLLVGARRGLLWRWIRTRRNRVQVTTESVLSALYDMWEEHGRQPHGHQPAVIRMAIAAPGNIGTALGVLRAQGLAEELPDGGWTLTAKGMQAVLKRNASPEAGP